MVLNSIGGIVFYAAEEPRELRPYLSISARHAVRMSLSRLAAGRFQCLAVRGLDNMLTTIMQRALPKMKQQLVDYSHAAATDDQATSLRNS